MNPRIVTITKTALCIALLIAAQYIGKMLGGSQFITGSLVNLILIIAAVNAGLAGGITVAFISPILAQFMGIGPKFIQLVPAIIIGNIVIVILMYLTYKLAAKNEKYSRMIKVIGIVLSSALKFLVLLVLVRFVIKAFFVPGLPPLVLEMFSYPQLLTALMGGFLSIVIIMALKKAESYNK